jgi:DNA polymerase-3 subunit alpha
LATLDQALAAAVDIQDRKASGQLTLFGDTPDPTEPRPLTVGRETSWLALLRAEKEVLGFYFSGHPLDEAPEILRREATHQVSVLTTLPTDQRVTLLAVVESLTYHSTRTGKPYVRLVLEDETGRVEAIAWSEVLEANRGLFKADAVLLVTGPVQRRDAPDDSGDVKMRETLIVQSVKGAHHGG